MYLNQEYNRQAAAPIAVGPIGAILLNAANEIVKRGHCKHMMYGPEGQVCAVAAIVTTMHFIYDVKPSEVFDHVKKYLNIPDLPDWNNKPERTQEEVIAAFRGAAAAGV